MDHLANSHFDYTVMIGSKDNNGIAYYYSACMLKTGTGNPFKLPPIRFIRERYIKIRYCEEWTIGHINFEKVSVD